MGLLLCTGSGCATAVQVGPAPGSGDDGGPATSTDAPHGEAPSDGTAAPDVGGHAYDAEAPDDASTDDAALSGDAPPGAIDTDGSATGPSSEDATLTGDAADGATPEGSESIDATLGGTGGTTRDGEADDAAESAAGDEGEIVVGADAANGGAEEGETDAPADGGVDDGASPADATLGPANDGAAPDAASDDSALDASASADAAAPDAPPDGPGDARPGDAGADAATIVPVLSNTHYVYSWNGLVLEIDPPTGGRVVTFSLGGHNVLTGPDANAINYGSTFWTSPQSDWGWPPLPEIDNLPYTASVNGGSLTLRGAVNGALAVSITKVFSVDAASGAVSIAYTITNAGGSARSFAPWEVTRVHTTGLMFFPTGTQAYSADSGPALPTQQAAGATWFDADSAATTADTKFFANAARGWIAQEASGMVFVKKFPSVSVGDQAPGEAEVEMFASGDRAYVELEDQGPYLPIAAGGSVTWSVQWFLQAVPAGVDAGVGSASLVAFVDGL